MQIISNYIPTVLPKLFSAASTLSGQPFRQHLVCPVQHTICLTDWLPSKSAFPHSTPQPSCPRSLAGDWKLLFLPFSFAFVLGLYSESRVKLLAEG